MPKKSKPRAGSLQFWPRKRARKFLPSVNWTAISSNNKLLGFIGYKVGMGSCVVKNLTPDSLTKNKTIIIPSTVLELPPMKIFSIKFYNKGKVIKDIIVADDKELKKKLKLSKKKEGEKEINEIKDYDDVRIVVYSQVKNTGIKKTPDLAEVDLGRSLEEKIKFIKEKLNKDIFASEILSDAKIIDVRGLTKGKGVQGPVKRLGIGLKQAKSEKGRRGAGSIGPWHPARVSFRIPMAGQLGMFSRICYNSKIILLNKISEQDINPKQGWKHYGKIKTEYLILEGSVQGPAKRTLLITAALRPTKKQDKKEYEFVRLR